MPSLWSSPCWSQAFCKSKAIINNTLSAFSTRDKQVAMLGKSPVEVSGAPLGFPAAIKEKMTGKCQSTLVILRCTKPTESKAGERVSVRGFGQHSFFPVLSGMDFDEDMEEFPSPQSHFPRKALIEACWSLPVGKGFPAPVANWEDTSNNYSRATCIAGNQKPAGRASRGVTDFLGR